MPIEPPVEHVAPETQRARRRWVRWLVRLSSGLIGLFLGFIFGGLTVLLLLHSQGAADITRSLGPQPDEAIITVLIDDSYVSREIGAGLAQQGGFTDPQVSLRAPDIALVTVGTRINLLLISLNLRPTATVQFDALDGKLRASIVNVSVEGLNVPRAWIEPQIADTERLMAAEIDAATAAIVGTDFRVLDVRVLDSKLVIALGEEQR